jgi:hypothetical protein
LTTGGALATAVFRWSENNGVDWAEVDVTTAVDGEHELGDTGVTVTFAATTGHTDTTYWNFQASWEDYFGNLIHAPAAGTVVEVNSYPITVPQSTGGYWRGPQTPPPAGGGGGNTAHPGPPAQVVNS